ncbi:hypothetical protein V8C40DRAFT_228749, partial [Trichoderma camerunense]
MRIHVLGKYCKKLGVDDAPNRQQRLFHHPTLLYSTMECTRTCTRPKTCKCTTRTWKRPEGPKSSWVTFHVP